MHVGVVNFSWWRWCREADPGEVTVYRLQVGLSCSLLLVNSQRSRNWHLWTAINTALSVTCHLRRRFISPKVCRSRGRTALHTAGLGPKVRFACSIASEGATGICKASVIIHYLQHGAYVGSLIMTGRLVLRNIQRGMPLVFSFAARTQSGSSTCLSDGTFLLWQQLIICLLVHQNVEVYEGDSSVKLHSFANTE